MVLLGPIMLQVKSEAELRHVIAHLYGAIEALTNGHARAASDELASVHGLVFFESDAEAEAYYQSQEGNHGRPMPAAAETQAHEKVVDC